MTEQIKKKLQEEINALEYELAHELPKELKKAIALGDLSENAEYHMAKQRQEFVKARLRQLGRRLADLSLINMSNIPKDKVGLGSTVKVYDNDKGEEIEYKLVTSEESDVAAGKISTTSPIGRALLNKKVGTPANSSPRTASAEWRYWARLTWARAVGKGCGFLRDAIVRWLALARINPNVLTFLGLVVNTIAACLFGY